MNNGIYRPSLGYDDWFFNPESTYPLDKIKEAFNNKDKGLLRRTLKDITCVFDSQNALRALDQNTSINLITETFDIAIRINSDETWEFTTYEYDRTEPGLAIRKIKNVEKH